MLSARAIAAEVVDKRLTPAEALDAGTLAIEQREADLQVFTHRNEDLKPGIGPLSGVSLGVKDIFDTYDMPTQYGSPIYEEHQPVADSAIVSMARAAGATIAGKTVTTEFAWFTPGPTRNPHNPDYTPGGSSSGSAAGVAAGFFPAAIGSQTGGSVIRPAAYCGVAGYKPSFRLFPTIGMKQFSWSLDTVGFFAATVEDVAFVAAHLSGRDLFIGNQSNSSLRIGIYRASIDTNMEPEMRVAIEKLESVLRNAGAAVVDITEPDAVAAAHAAHAPVQDYEAQFSLADELARNQEQLSPKLKNYLLECRKISPQAYDDARRCANHARKASRGLFDKCDVLLAPSSPGTAPHSLASTGNSVFNRLWTLLGMPCVNVDTFRGAGDLPLGVQVIAPFGQDNTALQIAHFVEKAVMNYKSENAPFIN